MHFYVPVYQRKRGAYLEWTSVGIGPFTASRSALAPAKVEQLLVEDMKTAVRAAHSRDVVHLLPKRGLRLVRLRLDMSLSSGTTRRRFTGEVPLVLEERTFNAEARLTIAYHPLRQDEWFPVVPKDATLSDVAHAYLCRVWAALSDGQLEDLKTQGKDLLRVVAFSASPKSLLDELRAKERGLWDDLQVDPARGQKRKRKGELKVLHAVGTDITQQIAAEAKPPGLPRSPSREQLQGLLGGQRRQPVFIVGPSGCGKTTLIEQWVWDLAQLEGYGSHRNLDRLTRVHRVLGKRLIAGMSYVGDWEQRVIDLFDEMRDHPLVLHIPDFFRFGKLGRARNSDRSLADLFRVALARRELSVVAEGTSEQLAQLEEDAPALAGLFTRLALAEPSQGDAFRMLLAEARKTEAERALQISPMALRTLLELSSSFGGSGALPGRAMQLFRRVVDHTDAEPAPAVRNNAEERRRLDVAEVVTALSAKLGLPRALLARDAPLDRGAVERQLATQVLGQPEATGIAADLIVRIKAGMVDARRPYGVYLFTGPTGTGKTELARCIAEFLFGSQDRLVRFDMSEYSDPDAAARLVGDFVEPEGLLTRAVREQPLSVVLLDEIDKAHSSVHGLMLQLFEDARLTDAAGNLAHFENTVVIMTSNLGARRHQPIGWGASPDPIVGDVARAVREFFSPELFNRIDRVVAFRPLAPETAIDVAEKELSKLKARRGLEMRDVFLEVGRSVIERLAREALTAREGARSLKRFLEDRVTVNLAEMIARDPGAGMRMLYLSDSADGSGEITVRDERLGEAAPLEGYELLLDRLEGSNVDELRAELAHALPRIRDLRDRARDILEQVRHDGGTTRYWAEMLLEATSDLAAGVEAAAGGVRVERTPEDEPSHTTHAAGTGLDYDRRRVRLTRPAHQPAGGGISREAMLALLARVEHISRAVEVVDADEHEVTLELVRIASPKAPRFEDAIGAPAGTRSASLLAWLARGYLAFTTDLQKTSSGYEGGAAAQSGNARDLPNTDRLEREIQGRPDCVILSLSGLGLRDALRHEEGCHVWQPLATGPEIVRVRLLPRGQSPLVLAQDFIKRSSVFRAAMTSGTLSGPLPENPAKLAPMVRRLSFEPAQREGRSSPVDLEDFVLGLAMEPPVRDPASIIARLLWLRASRRLLGEKKAR